MLEKKTYKFSKRGVEARNLTTGDKELVTLSSFGQQSSYEKKQETYVGNHKKSNHSSSNERLMQAYNRSRQQNVSKSTSATSTYESGNNTNSIAQSNVAHTQVKASEFSQREAYINRSQGDYAEGYLNSDISSTGQAYSPRGQFKYGSGGSSNPFTSKSKKRKEKALEMQMMNRVTRKNGMSKQSKTDSGKGKSSFADKIVSNVANKATNAVLSEFDKSDNVALQALSGSVSAVRTVTDVAKTTAKTYRHVKSINATARRTMRKITRKIQAKFFAKKGAGAAAKTAKMAAKELAKKTAQLVANPGTLKVLLIAVAIFLVIILLLSFGQSILTAMVGTTMEENADKATVEYIKNKDKGLIQEILDIQANLLASGAVSVEIFGLERINTKINPVLALLSVLNGGDTELTPKSMKILDGIHKKLNTYSIEEFSEVVSGSDGGFYYITRYEIYVDAYSVLQRIDAFGLSEEQKEILLIILEIHGEAEGSSPGEGSGNDGGDVPGDGSLYYPLGGYTNITSPYGERKDPITGKLGEFHPAVDISAPKGTPIMAAADGTVSFSGVRGTYGNLIIIDHEGGMQTYYAHCDTLIAKQGETVSAGQQIATVGTSGRSTGPHLHFEVRINGRHKNPMSFF